MHLTFFSRISFFAALGLAFVLISAPGSVLAQDDENPPTGENKDSPFEFEVGTGLEYDSNVSVIDIDLNTASGDAAAVLNAGIDFKKQLGKETKVKLGYNFSQSLHFDFTGFDIQTHRATVGLNHDFGAVTGEVNYIFVYSTLGGTGFLTFQRVSPDRCQVLCIVSGGKVGGKITVFIFQLNKNDVTDRNFQAGLYLVTIIIADHAD